MKKIISVLLAVALIISLVPLYAFAITVTSIDFTPADPNAYVFYEGQNAETRYDESTGESYIAYNINFSQGDTLTLHYSDGSQKDYVADFIDGEIYFINGDEKLMQWQDVTKFDNQADEHWVVGGEYTFDVVYGNFTTPVTAKIIPNPVDSISYTSSRPITCYFEAGGSSDIDAEGNDYYHYNAFVRFYNDVLTVNYNDGRGTVDYALKFDPEMGYYSDGGEFISDRDVRMFDRQYDEPFTLGDDNYIYVEYLGKTTPVQVTIVENPIYDLVYIPVRDIEIYENSNGRWDTDGEGNPFYNYDMPWFKAGDLLNVTYSDTYATVSYTYLRGEYDGQYYDGFYDVNNGYDPLPDQDTALGVSRHGEWELGDGNFMFVTYKDNESNYVRVEIVENPVKGIRYEKANPYVCFEGDTYYDNWDDAYYYNNPNFEDGDKLIVIDKNGEENTYVCDEYSAIFMNEDSDVIQMSDVSIYHHQREKAWVLGDKNEYYVEYMGNVYTLYASVIENPISAIEYTPAEPIVLIEGRDSYMDNYYGEGEYLRYNYPTQEIGDVLTIYYKDNTSAKYVLINDEENYWVFKNEQTGDTFSPWDVRFHDDQYHNPWHVGNGNDLYITYNGITYTYDVTILENPVQDIRFIPANDPVVYQGADSYYSDYYEREIYSEPRFNVGDRLIVTDKNDVETTYMARYDEFGDLVFAADDKEPLVVWQDVFTDSDQEEGTPWQIGPGNEYFVEYMGHTTSVLCTVKVNPVTAIEFIPATETVYLEGTHSHTDPWSNVSIYDIPRVENGDVLRVTYLDRTKGTVEYTAKYDQKTDSTVFESESGEIIYIDDNNYFGFDHEQYLEPWSVGDNYYTVYYMDCVSRVKVRIIENNYDGMYFTPVDGTPKVYEGYTHPAYTEDGNEYREYEIPSFKEGDKISLLGAGVVSEFILTFSEEDGELYFVGDNFKFHQYEVYRSSDQAKNPWTLEGPNYYTIEVFGLTADVDVDIVPTDVKSIEYIKKTPLELDENKNGEYRYNNFGTKFYFYNTQLADVGDQLIVTYKDDTTETFTVKFDPQINEGYAETDNGKRLNTQDIEIFDRQFDEPWIPN
ncbi:MAG: hypothetical protein IKZ59_05520 [Clostridia bacterium]|nr:hypothetical protein [Clostridia bacterium]